MAEQIQPTGRHGQRLHTAKRAQEAVDQVDTLLEQLQPAAWNKANADARAETLRQTAIAVLQMSRVALSTSKKRS